MADFAFWVENIPTGIVKAGLPLDDWSYDDTLNRAGSLTGKVPLTSEWASEQHLDPWRTAIYVLRDGKIEWGGILTPPSLSMGGSALGISCVEWTGYWDRRVIRTEYRPAAVDQFDIFEHLIDDAQDEAVFGDGWDLGITVTWDALSGVLRDRLEDYRPYQRKNLGEALRQLAAVTGGFDFAMRYTINPATDRVDKAIKLYYPRKGRDTGFLFEYERGRATNVLDRGFADNVDFAWVGDGWGEGQDVTALSSPYVDETLRGVYPPYDAAPSWSSVSEQATLDANTAAAFRRRNRPRRTPILRVDPDKYPRWGDYEIGDTVVVRITDGYGSTDGVVPQPNRVTGTKVAHDNTYEVTLADPDLMLTEEAA